MEIIPTLHRVPGVIGNPCLIVDADGLTLVDAGMRGSQRRILGYVRREVRLRTGVFNGKR